MKYKELKTKPEGEIRNLLAELRDEAHDLAVKGRLNQLKDTHKLKQVKKDIARIMTFMGRKEK
ncbi:MAG: 50S ribosomal protein L29 [Patescibacteria group bacterium]|nr:50S ribosomal protein L29 [Patescibacteria group bacterium]